MKAILVDKKLFTREYEVGEPDDVICVPQPVDLSMYNPADVLHESVKIHNFRLEKFITNAFNEHIAVYKEI